MVHNTDITLPITRIDLTVFGNDEVRRYSVARKQPHGLDVPDTIDKGEAVINGVLDARLGTTNMNRDCNTCGQDSDDCPCHMGHIRLPVDVYNEGFIVFAKKFLSCVCYECSRIPIDPANPALLNIMKMPNVKRLDAVRKLVASVKTCPFCGDLKPKIKKDTKESGVLRLLKEYVTKVDKNEDANDNDDKKKTKKEPITGDEAYRKLENISYETTRILGINPDSYRLNDLMIRDFPISALAIRPSVKAEFLAEGTSEDDLTKKTLDIVKQCDRIRNIMNNPNKIKNIEHKISNHTQLLQYNVVVYRNNDSKTLPKSEQKAGGKAMKSVTERIQGKDGRLRHDLEGKRTNFCARSVISADPNLSISEAGVPKYVAKILTIPMTVTKENIKELTKAVRNGRDIYPGANYVWPKNSLSSSNRTFIDLKHYKNIVKLHVGDIVEIHLPENTPVLFNRQPSLHKMSILCHRAKIIADDSISTFRLNVNVTDPYNADFDGDEMNMYVAQSIQALIENLMLASVDKNILTPCYSLPIVKFKQDTPAGLYMMTEKKQIISWHDAMNIAMHITGFDPMKIEKRDITSYELFSFILPNKINYCKKNAEGKKIIEIVNGELLYGKINNSILKNVLIMSIWERYGPKETRIFIDNAQQLSEMFLLHKSVSIGYKDTIPTKEIMEVTKKEIHSKIMETNNMLTEIENNPKLLDMDTFEKGLFSILQTVGDNIAATSFKLLDSNNMLYVLVDSGAKGSASNIGHVMAGRGQEVLKYARIDKTVNGRCLPHICFGDDTALSRGFVDKNYNGGMDPQSFWWYHQGAREGIINTAIKTAESGYQQRRLIKALESIMLVYDGTVRTSNGVILQMLYGDNQLDQTMQRKITFQSMSQNNADLEKTHLFTTAELKNYSDFKKKNITYVNELKSMRDEMREIQLRSHYKYGEFTTEFFQPANYIRIINDVKNTNDADNKPLSPTYILEQIDYILDHKNTALVYYHDSKRNPIKHKNEKKFKFLFKYALYEFLSPRVCIIEHKLNKTKLDIIVNDIIESFSKALVQPGEMVGIVSAQSMGEPLTQMTLSSFHKSGSGVAGLQGTPRLKELFGNAKNIATPIMFIYLKEEHRGDKQLVNKIAASLKFTTSENIIDHIVTIFDSDNIYTDKDKVDVDSMFSINMLKNVDLKTLPWLFRIFINREKMSEHDITMLDIKTQFINFWNEVLKEDKKLKSLLTKINNACIITNQINSEQPFVHIRLELNNIDDKTIQSFRDLLLKKFYIKGNEKIKKIDAISHDPVVTFDKETGEVKKEKEYVIYTSGINYEKIKEIQYIDQDRTICNDTRTIHNLYGIEAARSILLKEISGVFGNSINHHHIAMVCDLMTHTGDITSIDRFGINKLNTGVLSRATFEKTMEILTEAAIYNQTDHLKNVSSSIMLGKTFRGGTGLCGVMMDNEILENSEFGNVETKMKSHITLTKNNIIDDLIKKKDIRGLFIPELD